MDVSPVVDPTGASPGQGLWEPDETAVLLIKTLLQRLSKSPRCGYAETLS